MRGFAFYHGDPNSGILGVCDEYALQRDGCSSVSRTRRIYQAEGRYEQKSHREHENRLTLLMNAVVIGRRCVIRPRPETLMRLGLYGRASDGIGTGAKRPLLTLTIRLAWYWLTKTVPEKAMVMPVSRGAIRVDERLKGDLLCLRECARKAALTVSSSVSLRQRDAYLLYSETHWGAYFDNTIHDVPPALQYVILPTGYIFLLFTIIHNDSMANINDSRLTVTWSGVFRLDSEVPRQCSGPGTRLCYQSPIFLRVNRRTHSMVFVHAQQSAPSVAAGRCVWLTGEILARSRQRDTIIMVTPESVVELGSYASQLPAPLSILSVQSRGHVLGRAAHFTVAYEATAELVTRLGEAVFTVGNIVNLRGVVIGYVHRSRNWVVETEDAGAFDSYYGGDR
ncbi:uncharacterized protein MELLADRAFT_110856 [Melampsora larici-populina 98AG31]|uniref:Uncharacterized protein n=1 Tax=Melampsora larici-populina (strain 98AG31 / pathotype 3-4-7) TaxID=747676 RepID=F4S176_MELLP|nr:uncharacterized protein MELLADRAFT_110856 [Melampsora larici-populina 98AG31]EGG01612.1 hypothetical protein MELLADRAFT_110856 [Melampsora larici-populina 98AG31]